VKAALNTGITDTATETKITMTYNSTNGSTRTPQFITGLNYNSTNSTNDYIIGKGTFGTNNLLKISNNGDLTLSDGNGGSNETTINYVDLAKIDGITNGTAAASKALVLDLNCDLNSGIRDFSIGRDLTVTGDITLNGGDLKSNAGIVNVFDAATTINIGGAATNINIGTDTNQKNTLTIGGGGEDIVIINGNLQITGTQTTTNSTVISIKDPILEIGDDNTANDALDRGIKFKYKDSIAKKVGFFGMDNSANNERFVYLTSATDNGSTFSGTQGTIQANFTTGTDKLSITETGITNANAISGATTINGTGNLTMGTITMTGFSVDADGDTAVKSLNTNSGGITNTGAISGATTINATGIITGVGLNAGGAISGATTINATGIITGVGLNAGGAVSGATTINGTGNLTMGTITMTGFSVDADGDTAVKSLNANSGGITNTGAISGATTINATGIITGVGLNAGGAISGATTINASGIITGVGIITTGDITATGQKIGSGAITSTGKVEGTSITDGIATLSSGTLSRTNGTLTLGTSASTSITLIDDTTASSDANEKITIKNTLGTDSESILLYAPKGGIRLISGDNSVVDIDSLTTASSTITSDIRYKENIVPLNNSLEKVLQLRGVHYHWKDKEKFNDKLQMGFIAQEVEEICPELVLTKEDGFKAVNYNQSVSLLVEAIKEQNKLIVQLQEEVQLLKNKPKRTYKKKTDENSDN